MFQLLIAFIYELVQQSWLVATVLTKYFLLVLALASIREKNGFEQFSDDILSYSPAFVTLIVVLGTANIFLGIVDQPFLKVFSEVTAFLYFLYLFWKY